MWNWKESSGFFWRSQICTTSQKGHNHNFLECAWYNLHRLPRKVKNNHRTVLCHFIGFWANWWKSKTNSFLLRQYTLYIYNFHYKKYYIAPQTAPLFSLIFRLDHLLSFSIYKHEKIAQWKKIRMRSLLEEVYFAEFKNSYILEGLKKLENR